MSETPVAPPLSPLFLPCTQFEMLGRLRLLSLLVVCLLIGGGRTVSGPADRVAVQRAYTSHYLVFGTQDATGTPRILAIDFNRTSHGPDRVDYEYKLFVAEGADWSMPVYETWTADPSETPDFPARGGLTPTVTNEGYVRVEVDLPELSITVVPESPRFSFPQESAGASRTGHPQFRVEWNGTTYEGPGVYEWIRPEASSDAEDTDVEANRQLDDDATFGLYDWIVLYDDEGRLWHVSQGTLSGDFGYQAASEALPAETHDMLVRWTATEYDETAKMHSPTSWLVDVPEWGLRVNLQKQGEHRGHGEPQSDGTRPIYVQASVEGRGIIRGEEHQFFGMVEHIRD